jgi:hypothetical protein
MKGKVIDKDSKQPLYMATVALADANGRPYGRAVTTDDKGVFSIINSFKADKDGNSYSLPKLQISFIGYETLVQDVIEGATYELKPMTIGLNEVVIEGKKKTKNFWNNNKGWVILVGILGASYFGYKYYSKK